MWDFWLLFAKRQVYVFGLIWTNINNAYLSSREIKLYFHYGRPFYFFKVNNIYTNDLAMKMSLEIILI